MFVFNYSLRTFFLVKPSGSNLTIWVFLPLVIFLEKSKKWKQALCSIRHAAWKFKDTDMKNSAEWASCLKTWLYICIDIVKISVSCIPRAQILILCLILTCFSLWTSHKCLAKLAEDDSIDLLRSSLLCLFFSCSFKESSDSYHSLPFLILLLPLSYYFLTGWSVGFENRSYQGFP